jgi:hypothetical protein
MQTNPSWKEVLTQPQVGHHMVQIYQEEEFLAEAVTYFAREGLERGEAVIIVATAQHQDLFTDHLLQLGCDVQTAIEQQQLYFIEAQAMLGTFMQDRMPHWAAFEESVGSLIREAQLSFPNVRVYGEMVNLLWEQGAREAANNLEAFWNRLAERQSFSLLCAYFLDPLHADAYDGSLQCICNSHSHLIPSDNYELLDAAVSEAGHEVLGESLADMLRLLATSHPISTQMPPAQATLLYLSNNMPLTTEKVLQHARRHYHSQTSNSFISDSI